MSDFSWLQPFGAATGLVGTISGLVGAFLGYKGYRRANEVKALDLRLELRRTAVDARAIVGGLPSLLEQANISRRNTFVARGLQGSTMVAEWTKSWNADWKEVTSLKGELPASDNDQTAIDDHRELESRLVSIHRLVNRANQLRTKYEEELARDERLRDRRIRL